MKRLTLLLTTLFLLFSGQVSAHHLIISDHYVKETIPGTKISAAYMHIHNHSEQQRKLVNVTSDISERIELHQHIMDGDMMKMQQVNSIAIEANDYTVLQPHGYHIMIFALQQRLHAGQEIELSLYFDDQTTATIKVPVKGLARQ
ncbi:copper chaperone PCu(A)C [Thalassotalea maritima]|uniref:copper chaperone PCu(A)C n=1 Tax=Thalassotalea maritima TaxID=3242416 RepID=UPI003527E6E8